ncbi:hypothetical protein LTR66_002473 [Elasticomyces elasticus]|nr:hypothetical protein LTR28_006569 [Elasticomyces elasticus]KAK4998255.1 hypothetical protein LTR66_002473 [Elasticomyces elasticus]
MESLAPCANTASNTSDRAKPDIHALPQTSTPRPARHFPTGTNSDGGRSAPRFNIFKQGALFCPQMGNLPKFIPAFNRDSHNTEAQGTELDTLAPRRYLSPVKPAVQGTHNPGQHAEASCPVLKKTKSRNVGSVVNTRAAGEDLPSHNVLRNQAVQAVQAILGADAEVNAQFDNPWKDEAEDHAKHDNGDEEEKDDNDGDGGDSDDDDDDSDDEEDWVHLEEEDAVEPWTVVAVRWYVNRQVRS